MVSRVPDRREDSGSDVRDRLIEDDHAHVVPVGEIGEVRVVRVRERVAGQVAGRPDLLLGVAGRRVRRLRERRRRVLGDHRVERDQHVADHAVGAVRRRQQHAVADQRRGAAEATFGCVEEDEPDVGVGVPVGGAAGAGRGGCGGQADRHQGREDDREDACAHVRPPRVVPQWSTVHAVRRRPLRPAIPNLGVPPEGARRATGGRRPRPPYSPHEPPGRLDPRRAHLRRRHPPDVPHGQRSGGDRHPRDPGHHAGGDRVRGRGGGRRLHGGDAAPVRHPRGADERGQRR